MFAFSEENTHCTVCLFDYVKGVATVYTECFVYKNDYEEKVVTKDTEGVRNVTTENNLNKALNLFEENYKKALIEIKKDHLNLDF